MSPPTRLLSSQVEIDSFNEIFLCVYDITDEVNDMAEEFIVDELLDLGGLPEPEKKAEEKEDPKGDSFIVAEKKEALLLAEIKLPEEADAADPEWLSSFVHDCQSPPQPPPQPPSAMPAVLVPVKAKRSLNRRHAAAFWSISTPPALGDTSPVSSHSSSSSSSSSSYQRQNFHSIFNYKKNYLNFKEGVGPAPKKRRQNPKNIFDGDGNGGERRCTHCGVQKTPQWRAGPQGPRTLCNACGVRFKSGRLLPEYRPACSPTFISKIHSNSHRKVLEMRRKKVEPLFTAPVPLVHFC